MLELQVQVPRHDSDGAYDCVLTVHVGDDGTVVIDDPSGGTSLGRYRAESITELRVRDPRTRELVSLAEDPVTWARWLHTRLRSPYVVPILIIDTFPGSSPHRVGGQEQARD